MYFLLIQFNLLSEPSRKEVPDPSFFLSSGAAPPRTDPLGCRQPHESDEMCSQLTPCPFSKIRVAESNVMILLSFCRKAQFCQKRSGDHLWPHVFHPIHSLIFL